MSRIWKDGPEGLGGHGRRRRLKQTRSVNTPIGDKVIQLPKRARLLLVLGSPQKAAARRRGGDLAHLAAFAGTPGDAA
ncbi:MAG: hypothetical protein ACREN8_07975 [Candidatus Dormibacteraceae bacterium]